MKKLLTVLMALTMVFGFAAMASADPCLTCEDDPGNIWRGCEGPQSSCSPFDFDGRYYDDERNCGELWYDYCDPAKGELHRALFKICDCINDGTWDNLLEGDTVDISMEIMVDSGSGMEEGDNGVYWAEQVSSDMGYDGVGVQTYNSQTQACEDTDCYPDDRFGGDFVYTTASGAEGWVYSGTECDPDDDQTPASEVGLWRVVKFEPELGQQDGEHGYEVQADDSINNNSVWWIDIPEMRVDSDMIEGGEKVYVKICLIKELTDGGVCGECEGCCCTIYIGELCCDEGMGYEGELLYPYFPPASSTYWGLIGLTISNLSDAEGTVTFTLYETDGDTGTYTTTLGAEKTWLETLSNLVSMMATTGTLGDSIGYIVAETTFSAAGFVMIANPDTGESMGYLPMDQYESSSMKYMIRD